MSTAEMLKKIDDEIIAVLKQYEGPVSATPAQSKRF